MGFFKNDKKGKPPHTWYPQILYWKVGDKIRSIDLEELEHNSFIENLMLHIDGFLEKENVPINHYLYKSVTDDGFIIVSEKNSKKLYKVKFKNFIKNATNLSFKERSIQQDLFRSAEYMQLIETFQKSFKELENSD